MTPEQIVPVNGRVFIEVLPPEKQQYDGLISFESTAQDKSNMGIVKALPLGYTENGQLSVGQKVIFNRHSGSVMKFDYIDKNAPEYRLIKEEDIFSLINELHR